MLLVYSSKNEGRKSASKSMEIKETLLHKSVFNSRNKNLRIQLEDKNGKYWWVNFSFEETKLIKETLKETLKEE